MSAPTVSGEGRFEKYINILALEMARPGNRRTFVPYLAVSVELLKSRHSIRTVVTRRLCEAALIDDKH